MAFAVIGEKKENVVVISIKGYVNPEGGKEIRARVNSFLQKGEKYFLLDFEEAPLISSAALGQILEMVSEVVANPNLKFCFSGLSETNKFSFLTIGLLENILEFSKKEDGMKYLKS